MLPDSWHYGRLFRLLMGLVLMLSPLATPVVYGLKESRIASEQAARLIPELVEIGSDLILANSNGDLSLLAHARYRLAAYYAKNQQWSVAADLIKTAIVDATYTGDRLLLGDMMLLMARIDFISGNPTGSEKTLLFLLNRWSEEGDMLRKSDAMMELASVYQRKGQRKAAWPLLQEAVSIATSLGQQQTRAAILQRMGVISHDMGDVALAARSLIESASLYSASGDLKSQAMVSITLAGLLIDAHLYETAASYARDAVLQYRRMPFSAHRQRLLGYALNTLGMALSYGPDRDATKRAFEDAIRAWGAINDVKNQVFAIDNLANMSIDDHNIAKAHQFLASAFHLNGDLRNDIQSAVILHTKSRYYSLVKNTDSAIITALSAGTRFLHLGVLSLAAEAFNDLSGLYSQKGDFREALTARNRWKSITDSINSGLATGAIASLQIEYETRLAKETIHYLNHSLALHKTIIQRKTGYLVTVVVALFLIISLAVMLALQVRKRNQAYAVLLQKNMEIMKIGVSASQSKPMVSSGSTGSEKPCSDQHVFVSDAEGILQRLCKAMEVEKKYLDPHLTLAGLAQQLNTNTSYLSRVINDEHQTNFNAYINRYRVTESCRLLQLGAAGNKTFEALGQQVGFNTRASFHAAFKKITGLTPGIYVDQMKTKGLINNKV